MSAIEQWLPHREPFRFVDELVEVAGDTGRCALNLAPDDPRLSDGRFQPLLLVEALAQCTAVIDGYLNGGKPASGLLAEVQASFHSAARGGERVDLEVRRVREHGPLLRYVGRATVGDRLCVEAELTVVRERDNHG